MPADLSIIRLVLEARIPVQLVLALLAFASVTAASTAGAAGVPAAAVDAAVDQVRRRYGKSALTRGVLVGRHPGLEMPHLPD